VVPPVLPPVEVEPPVAVEPPLPAEPPFEEPLLEPPQARTSAPKTTTNGRESFASMGACSLFVRPESRDS
jgi:hypothetical protein